jgi:D-inositol-3-phosphate glycosyltransferase
MISGGFDPLLPVPIGPIESYVYGLSKELAHVHQMNVIGYGQGFLKEKNLEISAILGRSKLLPIFREVAGIGYGQPFGFNSNVMARASILNLRKKFDLIHFNVIFSAPIAWIFKSLYNIPAICSLHNVVRTAIPLHFCDKIIVNSNFVKLTLTEKHRINYNKVEVVPIPIEEFQYSAEEKREARQELKFNNYKIVLFVGRKHYGKGPQVLLEAMPKVLGVFPKTLAFFIGPDYGFSSNATSFTKRLKKRAKELGIQSNILFFGYTYGRALRNFLYAGDVLVCPTIIEEAFGKIIVEAMSASTPVVASNIGAIPELINPDVTGLLVPPNDITALSNALIRILGDPHLASNIGRNGLDFVQNKFTYAAASKQCLSIYESIKYLH